MTFHRGQAIVILSTIAIMTALRSEARSFLPGEMFPEIVLPRLDDGSAASLADFRGQKLMMQIFASW
jgi:hypothetical protein